MGRLIWRGECPVCKKDFAGAECDGNLTGLIRLRKHKTPDKSDWCPGWGALVEPQPKFNRPRGAKTMTSPILPSRKAEPMTWTHAQCEECWETANPGRVPVRVKDAERVWCCFCALPTSAGIYVRHDPRTLDCEHSITTKAEDQP